MDLCGDWRSRQVVTSERRGGERAGSVFSTFPCLDPVLLGSWKALERRGLVHFSLVAIDCPFAMQGIGDARYGVRQSLQTRPQKTGGPTIFGQVGGTRRIDALSPGMGSIDRAVNAEAMGLEIAKQQECLRSASMATFFLKIAARNPGRIVICPPFLGLPIRLRVPLRVNSRRCGATHHAVAAVWKGTKRGQGKINIVLFSPAPPHAWKNRMLTLTLCNHS